MKRLKKYRKAFAGTAFCTFLLLSISYSSNTDRFLELLENIKDESLKEKLLAFQKDGIELEPDVSEYDPAEAVEYARSFLNTPHKMGGCTKDGIDCSGLVMVVHKKFSIDLPHSAHEQARYGRIVSRKQDLQTGDLVFFYNTYNSKDLITHSGIYIGDGEFIHTSNSKGVTVSQVDDPYYWGERFIFGTRLQ